MNPGGQSEATLTIGSDSAGQYQSLDLTFRLENLDGGVTIRDYTGTTPEYGAAEELADLLQDRIDAVLDGDGPGRPGRDPDYEEMALDRCIDDYGQNLEQEQGVIGAEPLRERRNVDSDNDREWATFVYVAGSETESVRYYECLALDDGVTLVIVHDAPAEDFEDKSYLREDLLEGLAIPS